MERNLPASECTWSSSRSRAIISAATESKIRCDALSSASAYRRCSPSASSVSAQTLAPFFCSAASRSSAPVRDAKWRECCGLFRACSATTLSFSVRVTPMALRRVKTSLSASSMALRILTSSSNDLTSLRALASCASARPLASRDCCTRPLSYCAGSVITCFAKSAASLSAHCSRCCSSVVSVHVLWLTWRASSAERSRKASIRSGTTCLSNRLTSSCFTVGGRETSFVSIWARARESSEAIGVAAMPSSASWQPPLIHVASAFSSACTGAIIASTAAARFGTGSSGESNA